MNVLSLFDGMSCGQIALNRMNLTPTKYYAAEVDKYAIKVTQANFPNTIQLGDVTKWREWSIDWSSIDLLIGGSPCQGFSFAGKQLAFDDPRSELFFVFVDILEHIKSVNPDVKFLLENVKMKQEHLDVITEYLGVEPIRINSDLVSAQNRDRYYWCNWHVEQPEDKNLFFQWVLDSDHAMLNKSFPLTATYFKGGGEATRQRQFKRSQRPIAWIGRNTTRWLTPVECERLQTVPDNYTNYVSNTQRYKMLGNGWTVDTVAHIFKTLEGRNEMSLENEVKELREAIIALTKIVQGMGGITATETKTEKKPAKTEKKADKKVDKKSTKKPAKKEPVEEEEEEEESESESDVTLSDIRKLAKVLISNSKAKELKNLVVKYCPKDSAKKTLNEVSKSKYGSMAESLQAIIDTIETDEEEEED